MPRPTKEEPLRIGFAQVVPRHMTAPPQWIGGWVGCICARTAEWMPSAPTSSAAGGLGGRAVGLLDRHADAAVRVLAVAGHAAPEPDRLRTDPLHDLPVQQQVELTAMNGVLRPPVPGQAPARLGIDVVAVEPDQRPLLCGQAHAVEIVLGDAQIAELPHGIGLQIDADAERAHFPGGLEDDAGHADLVQRQGGREPADAAAGDDYGTVGQFKSGLQARVYTPDRRVLAMVSRSTRIAMNARSNWWRQTSEAWSSFSRGHRDDLGTRSSR